MADRLPVPTEIESIRDYVTWWNSTFPLDRWWRKKHSVVFGSKAHHDHCLLDMRFEFEEDAMFFKLENEPTSSEKYTPGRGDWLIKKEREALSETEVDDLFDNVDIGSIKEERGADGKLRINASMLDE